MERKLFDGHRFILYAGAKTRIEAEKIKMSYSRGWKYVRVKPATGEYDSFDYKYYIWVAGRKRNDKD